MRNFIRTRNRIVFSINQNAPILGIKNHIITLENQRKKINYFKLLDNRVESEN